MYNISHTVYAYNSFNSRKNLKFEQQFKNNIYKFLTQEKKCGRYGIACITIFLTFLSRSHI